MPITQRNKIGMLEAMLFANAEPVETDRLAEAMRADPAEVLTLLFYRDWAVAVLLQDFHNALALCQTRFGVGIQVGAKLGKALQLAVLGVNQF